MRHEREEGRPRARRRRGGGSAVTGILVAAALVLSGVTGYVVGAATSAPSAVAAAIPSPTAMTATPEPSTPSPAPSATAMQNDMSMSVSTDDSSNAPLDADMAADTETLADGQSGRSDANLSSTDVEVLNWVETDDPVFFITIDDGLKKSPAVRDFIAANQIPVTAFLTEYAVRDHTDYFEAVTAYGGSIQNHSMVHGAFNDPETDVQWEICETQDRFEAQFGTRPWMLRPPYGAGPNDPQVLQYAQECGINRIVLWNVLVTDTNQVEYWDAPLRAGDIVLFHFVDGLEVGLEKILELGREQGLTPAPLEDYI